MQQIKTLATVALLLAMASAVHAADIDMKLTTTDGTSKVSVLDSGSVEVASVTSDGHGYFQSLMITTGNVSTQMTIGDVMIAGVPGANTDSYVALPFTSGAAIGTKQVVILNTSGQIVTTTVNSTNTVVGITVSASGAGGQKIYVATNGILTGVTCQTAAAAGSFACTGAGAGRLGACGSLTSNSLIVGRMLTACTAAGTGTVFLHQH